ncbi:hypothetical protein C5B42_01115, partial [Candidatus Cerribacteria bacterium 'Amazon FNV 2010 28 9']
TKSSKDEFTEAESTDNDFFRNLGESGILGVIGFYGPIAIFMWAALKAIRVVKNPVVLAFLFGMMAGTVGLLLNGVFIDVFEASKVAFPYWSLVGVGLAAIEVETRKMQDSTKIKKRETRK